MGKKKLKSSLELNSITYVVSVVHAATEIETFGFGYTQTHNTCDAPIVLRWHNSAKMA